MSKTKTVKEPPTAEAREQEPIPADLQCEVTHTVYTVSSLLTTEAEGRIKKPFIQRKFVWSEAMQRSYIVTLLIGALSPSIMLVVDEDRDDQIRYILDGHQRLSTLVRFRNDELELDAEIPDLHKMKFSQLSQSVQNKLLFTKLPVSETKAFRKHWGFLFRRINKSGMVLSDQEIRRAVWDEFSNPVLNLIEDISETHSWWTSVLYGPNTRYKGTQSLLRAVALHMEYQKYSKPMSKFLDSYCYRLVHKKTKSPKDLETNLDLILNALHDGIGRPAFRISDEKNKPVNLGLLDVMMHAALLILERKPDVSARAFQKLLVNAREYALNTEAISTTFAINTSGRDSVMNRMRVIEEYVENTVK